MSSRSVRVQIGSVSSGEGPRNRSTMIPADGVTADKVTPGDLTVDDHTDGTAMAGRHWGDSTGTAMNASGSTDG
jgi:hypothetical protein